MKQTQNIYINKILFPHVKETFTTDASVMSDASVVSAAAVRKDASVMSS